MSLYMCVPLNSHHFKLSTKVAAEAFTSLCFCASVVGCLQNWEFWSSNERKIVVWYLFDNYLMVIWWLFDGYLSTFNVDYIWWYLMIFDNHLIVMDRTVWTINSIVIRSSIEVQIWMEHPHWSDIWDFCEST